MPQQGVTPQSDIIRLCKINQRIRAAPIIRAFCRRDDIRLHFIFGCDGIKLIDQNGLIVSRTVHLIALHRRADQEVIRKSVFELPRCWGEGDGRRWGWRGHNDGRDCWATAATAASAYQGRGRTACQKFQSIPCREHEYPLDVVNE